MKKIISILFILLTVSVNLFSQETAKEINLNDYAGQYFAEGKEQPLTITVEGGKLFASTGNQKYELTRIKGDDFELQEISVGVSFIRSKQKIVDGILIVNPDGSQISGNKKMDEIASDLKEFTGEYYRVDGEEKSHLFITETEGILSGADDKGKFELTRIKGDNFEIKELSFGVVFTRSEKKIVDGIKIIKPDGNELIGKKVVKKQTTPEIK